MSKILRYKFVKTRKPHVCFGCGRCFEPPCRMISAADVDGGTVESYYLCESCDEKAYIVLCKAIRNVLLSRAMVEICLS